MLATSVLTAGCAPPQNKQEQGTRVGLAGGAALGALLGQAIGGDTTSTLVGATIGGIAGGAIGTSVGQRMDQQEAAMRAQLAAVEAANIQRNADVLAVTFRSDYFFDIGSATLKPGAYSEISRVSQVLNQYPDTNIQVAGHTDSTGSDKVNQELSQKRADAVRNYLIANGFPAENIQAVGYGSSKPIGDNATSKGRQANRRVEIYAQK